MPLGTVLISTEKDGFVDLLVGIDGPTLTWLDLITGRVFSWNVTWAQRMLTHAVVFPSSDE